MCGWRSAHDRQWGSGRTRGQDAQAGLDKRAAGTADGHTTCIAAHHSRPSPKLRQLSGEEQRMAWPMFRPPLQMCTRALTAVRHVAERSVAGELAEAVRDDEVAASVGEASTSCCPCFLSVPQRSTRVALRNTRSMPRPSSTYQPRFAAGGPLGWLSCRPLTPEGASAPLGRHTCYFGTAPCRFAPLECAR